MYTHITCAGLIPISSLSHAPPVFIAFGMKTGDVTAGNKAIQVYLQQLDFANSVRIECYTNKVHVA